MEGKEREGNNCFVALMFYCEGGDNVLELYRGGGCLTLCVKNDTELFILKWLILCYMNLTLVKKNICLVIALW